MNEIVRKITSIEKETSLDKGDYNLFALFLREESPNRWDILVSANWIDENKAEALRYLSQKIQQEFTREELTKISRIVIIEEDNPALPALQQAIDIEHGNAEIKDSNFFGLQIKHAFLITSRNRQAA